MKQIKSLREKRKLVNCTISGSFRKHYPQLLEAYDAFDKMGITVLSPARSRIMDPTKEFVILEADLRKSRTPDIRDIEDEVLTSIRKSHFLYVCNPGGYVGVSTAFEICCAVEARIKIIAMHSPEDPMIAKYVDRVALPKDAVMFAIDYFSQPTQILKKVGF